MENISLYSIQAKFDKLVLLSSFFPYFFLGTIILQTQCMHGTCTFLKVYFSNPSEYDGQSCLASTSSIREYKMYAYWTCQHFCIIFIGQCVYSKYIWFVGHLTYLGRQQCCFFFVSWV